MKLEQNQNVRFFSLTVRLNIAPQGSKGWIYRFKISKTRYSTLQCKGLQNFFKKGVIEQGGLLSNIRQLKT